MSKRNNILITGGLGFIGSNLAKIILKKKLASKCILLDEWRNDHCILMKCKEPPTITIIFSADGCHNIRD